MHVPRATLWLLAIVCLLHARAAVGQDFRIHTQFFTGDVVDAVSQNTTLFHGGLVYDFQSEPLEVSIFDRPRGGQPGRFILLDPARRVQTEVSLEEIEKFTERLITWAGGRDDPLLNFLSSPDFAEQLDAGTGTRTFSSRWISYSVTSGAAEDRTTFQAYDEFADWFVKLNTMLNIRRSPPYGLARLAVNRTLRQQTEIPEQVVLTVSTQNRFLRNQVRFRTEHHLTNRLSETDRQRIEQAGVFRTTFRQVDFNEYLQTTAERFQKPEEP